MTASLERFAAPKTRLKTECPFLFQFYAAAVREKLPPALVVGGGGVVVPVSAKGSPFGFSITSRRCQMGGKKRVFLALDSLASDDDEVTVRGSREACDIE